MPRLTKLTAMMMAIACQSDVHEFADRVFDHVRLVGDQRRLDAERQIGGASRCIACSTLRPSARMSPPSRMAIARPIAGLPLTRNIGCGGSAKPRRTSRCRAAGSGARSTAKLTSRMSSSDSKAPDTRRRQLLVAGLDACRPGLTAFCACSAAISAARSMPRPASCSVENSTKIRSSCAPRISILETSGTCSRRERIVLDVVAQFAMGEAVGGEAVDDPESVAEVVVEAGPTTPAGKVWRMSATLLADLIPDVRHLPGRRRALQVDEDGRQARAWCSCAGNRGRRFLQRALEPFGDLLQRVVHRRAGPGGLHDHRLDDEGRVLAAAEPRDRKGAPPRSRRSCR